MKFAGGGVARGSEVLQAEAVGRRTMRDKALDPAYMFPTNRREAGSQERAADLWHI